MNKATWHHRGIKACKLESSIHCYQKATAICTSTVDNSMAFSAFALTLLVGRQEAHSACKTSRSA